jgi:hypothetical protein
MQAITTIGFDIAKSVFQVHGIDAQGNVISLTQCTHLSLHKDVPIPRSVQIVVARWRCPFWADCTTNISEHEFPTGTEGNRRQQAVSLPAMVGLVVEK